MKFVFLLVLLCAVGSNAGQQELPPGALPNSLFSSVMFHCFNLQVSKASFIRAALTGRVRITCILFVLQLVSMETLSGIQMSS